MQCFVVFIEYFGKCSLCYPIGRIKPKSTIRLSVSRVAIALWCTLLVALYCSPCHECKRLTNFNPALSFRISYYIMSLTMITSDLILRAPAIFVSNDLLLLVAAVKKQVLVKCKTSMARISAVYFSAILGALKFVGLILISIKVHIINGIMMNWERTSFRSLMERLGYIACDWSCAASLLFSLIFTTVVGLILLNWFERWVDTLKTFAPKSGNLRIASSTLTTDNKQAIRSNNGFITEEFVQIRAAFEAYGRVAGAYALGLTVNSTLNLINVLAMLMPGKDYGNLQDFVGEFYHKIYHLTFLPSLILLCVFGNYLSKQVS